MRRALLFSVFGALAMATTVQLNEVETVIEISKPRPAHPRELFNRQSTFRCSSGYFCNSNQSCCGIYCCNPGYTCSTILTCDLASTVSVSFLPLNDLLQRNRLIIMRADLFIHSDNVWIIMLQQWVLLRYRL